MLTAAVAVYLTGAGLVDYRPTQPGGDVFLQDLPDGPDVPADAVGLYLRPGARSSGTLGYDEPGLQVIVRADPTGGRARTGYERAERIRGELVGLRAVTLAPGTPDEVYLVGIRPDDAGPTDIGRDSADRPRWSVRLVAHIRNVTAHRE